MVNCSAKPRSEAVNRKTLNFKDIVKVQQDLVQCTVMFFVANKPVNKSCCA